MSTPYSSSRSTKVRNSPVPASPAAPSWAVVSWVAWADVDMARSLESEGRKGGGSGRHGHRRGLGQAAGIDDQRHAPVAEDGGAGHAGDALVVALEVLHHHLLLAEQFVDLQRQAAAVGFDHHRHARR